jgi:hypothetical protein
MRRIFSVRMSNWVFSLYIIIKERESQDFCRTSLLYPHRAVITWGAIRRKVVGWKLGLILAFRCTLYGEKPGSDGVFSFTNCTRISPQYNHN